MMKKNIYRLQVVFLLVAGLLSATSCNDWLDVKPKTEEEAEELFSTIDGFKSALAGVYIGLSQSGLYGREMTFGMVGVLGQEWGDGATLKTNYSAYNYLLNYNYEQSVSKALIDVVWNKMYENIANVNTLIQYTDLKREVLGDYYEVVKGEALALRAYMHFDLLRLFAPYDFTAEAEPAIPYVREAVPAIAPQLTPAKFVELALADVDDALGLLKEDPVYTGADVAGEDNGYCLSLVEADGERTFITVQGAECHFKKEWFEQIDMDNYENIYIAGYQVCGKSGEIISQWLKTVENVEEKHIFFAPGPMITAIESETMENLFALKPILHINEAEAKSYTEQENVEEAVRALYEKSGNLVFVTLGAEGTLFYDGKEMRRVASVKTNVVDTVGAGDSHIGAIIAGMSKGMKVEDAVLLANRTAAAIVGTSGPVMDLEEFQKISEEWENE